MAMIDYEKAFASIKIYDLLNAESNGRIDDEYRNAVNYISENVANNDNIRKHD